jgi:hypothetical protein
MPRDVGDARTPNESLSLHILPSSPSSPPPLGAPHRRLHFETRVIPRSVAINEAELASSLVTMVRGACLSVSVSQVLSYLGSFFQVTEQEVCICCSSPVDFLLIFNDPVTVDRVLHAPMPHVAEFILVFHRRRRQTRARFSPLHSKVLLVRNQMISFLV